MLGLQECALSGFMLAGMDPRLCACSASILASMNMCLGHSKLPFGGSGYSVLELHVFFCLIQNPSFKGMGVTDEVDRLCYFRMRRVDSRVISICWYHGG